MGCEGDCDDDDPTTHLGAEEICDGLDNDCDDTIDEVDQDGDGFAPEACEGDDCDDSDSNVHPLVAEDCSDNVDNDCDGHVDDADDECLPVDDDDIDEVSGDDDSEVNPGSQGCECSASRSPTNSWRSIQNLWFLGALGWLIARR